MITKEDVLKNVEYQTVDGSHWQGLLTVCLPTFFKISSSFVTKERNSYGFGKPEGE